MRACLFLRQVFRLSSLKFEALHVPPLATAGSTRVSEIDLRVATKRLPVRKEEVGKKSIDL